MCCVTLYITRGFSPYCLSFFLKRNFSRDIPESCYDYYSRKRKIYIFFFVKPILMGRLDRCCWEGFSRWWRLFMEPPAPAPYAQLEDRPRDLWPLRGSRPFLNVLQQLQPNVGKRLKLTTPTRLFFPLFSFLDRP